MNLRSTLHNKPTEMLISKGRGRVGDIVMNVECPRRRGSGVEFIVRELFRKDLFGERRKKR